MAQKTWTGGYSNWTTAAAWGGTLPGSGDDVVIAYGVPYITTDVGTVRSVQDGTTPTPNARLQIYGGRLHVTGSLMSVNALELDDSGAGGGRLAVDGTLTSRGSLDIGNDQLTQATTLTAGRLVNTGRVQLRGSPGQVRLDVLSAAGDGVTGHLGGSYMLISDAVLSFGGGQITTLDGSIDMQNASARIADASELGTNSALRGLTTISSTGRLLADNSVAIATTGNLTNNGELDIDSRVAFTGGSSLQVGGTLTQNGLSFWGASRLGTTVNITARALNNTGRTYVFGGVSSGAMGLATVSIGGASTNSGLLTLDARATLETGSFRQTAAATTAFGAGFGPPPVPNGAIRASGAVTLDGGTALLDPLQAGQTRTLATFAPGMLTGMFDHVAVQFGPIISGSGTTVREPDGTLVGVLYNNAAGTLTMVTAAPVSTTIDTYKGGSGSWTDAGHWSAGVPTFYSDATIGPGGTQVTLGADATVNSLALGAGDTLRTAAGTDLSIGATVSVASGATLAAGGEITVASSLTNNGQVTVTGMADVRGNASGSGQFTIGDHGSLAFGAASSSRVSFSGAAAQLKLDTPYLFTGTLANLGIGDSIDLVGTKIGSVSGTTGALVVRKLDGSSQTFALDGVQGRTGFGVQDDGAGGSRIVVLPYGPPRPGPLPAFSGAAASLADAGSRTPSAQGFAKAEGLVATSPIDALSLTDRNSLFV